jgi:predicted dehydrogenase
VARPLRIASVGLGWWGRLLAESAVACGAGEVVACHSRRAEARETFAADFGCTPLSTLDDLLAHDEVEALVVATPHSTHGPIVLAALERGKHVFVEKPLTLTVDEGERCVRAAQEGGLVLQVGHHRRRQTANRRIRAMIADGDLGIVQHIEANMSAPTLFGWPEGSWRRRREEMPAGAMTVMGCHMLDTMQFFAGTPRRVCAISKRVLAATDVDDATSVLVEFESGPIGYLGTSPAVPKTTTIAVFGTDAAVWNDEDGARLFVQRRDEEVRSELELEPNDPVAEELTEFAQCVHDGGRPETGGEASLEVVRMIEAIVRSAEEGVFVDLASSRQR